MKHYTKRILNVILVIFIFLNMSITASATPIFENQEVNEEKVPLYFQTDYPSVAYGHGTVATSGCGITSLAMVASYIKDEEILPDELANEFGSRCDSNMGRMEYASTEIGLEYEKVFTWEEAIDALEDGKVAIALVNSETKFTGCQHFIVLTGITDDGKITVNDPYEPNYSKDALVDGFENGFEETEIRWGFSGAWIYSK